MAESAPQQFENAATDLNIHTIPMEFYGGKNPDPIEFGLSQNAQGAQNNQARPTPQPVRVQPVVVPAATATQGALVRPAVSNRPAGSSKKIYILAAVGVAVLLAVTAGSYWWFIARPAAIQVPIAPPAPVVLVTTPTSTPEIVPEEPENVVPTSTIEIATSTEPIIIPNHSFVDSEDGDNDGLTDVEEELWGTNGALADSDGDGYDDRVELLNLYNPRGVAPERLIDANVVNTYVNPEYGYQVYYPNSWLPSALSADKKEVIFTSITQEFVQITALPFPTDVPFVQWFATTFPQERLGLYVPFVNRFKVSGVISEDGAVAVITDGSHVYILTYNGGVRETINYRSSFKMMVHSFKTANVTTPIDLLPSTVTPVGLPTNALPVSAPTESATSSAVDIDPEDVVFVTSTAGTSLNLVEPQAEAGDTTSSTDTAAATSTIQ